MSSLSSVSSTSNPYQVTTQNSFSQIAKDFRVIGAALQSGNLSTVQSALATFQQDLQRNSQNSTAQPFGNNSQANAAYQNLTSALQSGNFSGAQSAFASLQKDLAGAEAGKTHKGHHHGSGGGSTESLVNTLPTSSSTTSSDSTSTTLAADSDGDNDGSSLNVTA
jgi:hypothetical protein